MKGTAYLIQAALIAVWWVGLAWSPSFFEAFQFSGISSTAFWAFFGPDILVIAGLSLVRAYREDRTLEWIVLGAFAYAALYCCNATVLTNSGYLPTGLMILGLCYNAFLCFPNAAFRASSAGHTAANASKTLLQILCVWTLTLVVVPYILLDAFGAVGPPTMSAGPVVGAGLFLASSLLGLTSAFFLVRDGNGTPLPLDQTNALVMSGPYRYVCNPMAVAGIGQGISIALIFQSTPILVYSLLGAGLWHCVMRPVEERDLAARFGDAYLDYRQGVSCWIPTFRRDAK